MQSIFNAISSLDKAFPDKTLVVGGDSRFYDKQTVAGEVLQSLIEALSKQIDLLARQRWGNCKIELVDIEPYTCHSSPSVVT